MIKRQDASTGKLVEDVRPPAAASAAAPPAKNARREMHVKVYSPFQVYFDDMASSISAVNDTGPFDILPGHRNFLTLLGACNVVIATNQGKRTIQITRGMMHVKADQVIVFLDV